jgi:hypothetical protein
MRKAILILFLLSACRQEPAAPAPRLATGSFAGDGRDRLCLSGSAGSQRAGLIVFGEGGTNCSAAGRIERQAEGWALIPRGEGEGGCAIPLSVADGAVTIATPGNSCAYYCGPGAKLAGKRFFLDRPAPAATDLAGDPLC